MNLILRPLSNTDNVTWSIIWCMIILVLGVSYCIYTIMKVAYEELEDGIHDSPKQEELL